MPDPQVELVEPEVAQAVETVQMLKAVLDLKDLLQTVEVEVEAVVVAKADHT